MSKSPIWADSFGRVTLSFRISVFSTDQVRTGSSVSQRTFCIFSKCFLSVEILSHRIPSNDFQYSRSAFSECVYYSILWEFPTFKFRVKTYFVDYSGVVIDWLSSLISQWVFSTVFNQFILSILSSQRWISCVFQVFLDRFVFERFSQRANVRNVFSNKRRLE